MLEYSFIVKFLTKVNLKYLIIEIKKLYFNNKKRKKMTENDEEKREEEEEEKFIN